MSEKKHNHLARVGLATVTLMASGSMTVAKELKPATATMSEVVVTGQKESETGYAKSTLSISKFSGSVHETPQSISVVPAAVLNDQNSTTMRKALSNTAGVSIAAGEGGAQGDNLTLRGFSARNDIFLDGMRDFGSYYRDAFNWESVEVYKGPSSTSFGRGSTGGAINQVSKLPDENPAIEAAVVTGTSGKNRVSIDVNQPLSEISKGVGFRLNAVQEVGNIEGRDTVNVKHWGLAPELSFGMGSPTRVDLMYLHERSEDIPDYGLPFLFNAPAPVERHNYYGFKSDYLKTQADIVTAKVTHDWTETTTIRDQIRYGVYARSMRATEAKIAGSPTLTTPISDITVNRNEINTNSQETFFQNQLDAVSKFKVGTTDHTFSIGLEMGRETSSPTRYTITGVPTTNLKNPNPDQAYSGTNTLPTITRAQSDSIGIYALDTIELDSHWQLVGGLRWDKFDTSYIQDAATPLNLSASNSFLSWRGALTYKPADNGSIYIGYGSSFNPSAEALSLSAGNASLAPEENRTYEVGTKWEWFKKKLSTRVALFRTEKINARETNPTNSAEVVLSGSQSVTGLEIETVGQLSPHWQVMAGYAYMASRVDSSLYFPASLGEPLANVPKHTFNFWTTYDLPWGVKIGGGGNFVDSRRASSTVPNDTTTGLPKEVPGYWVFNAMIGYQVSKKIEVQLNLYNLTDNYYIEQVSSGRLIPGEGRSGTLTASFKL